MLKEGHTCGVSLERVWSAQQIAETVTGHCRGTGLLVPEVSHVEVAQGAAGEYVTLGATGRCAQTIRESWRGTRVPASSRATEYTRRAGLWVLC